MRRPGRRALLWSLLVGGGLLLVGAAVLVILLFTPPGARYALGLVRDRLPAGTEIEAVRGRLIGPLSVTGVRVLTKTASITVDTVTVEWRLSRLLRRRLDVTRLRLEGVNVTLREATQRPAAQPRDTLPSVNLPLAVLLPDVVVRRIDVITPRGDGARRLDSLTLAATVHRDRLEVDALVVRGQDVYAELRGYLRPAGDYPVEAEYRWTVRVKGKAFVGQGRLSGDLDRLTWEEDVTSPLGVSVRATAESLLGERTFTASVAVTDLDLSRLDSTLAEGQFNGRLDLHGSLAEFTASATAWGRHEMVDSVSARLLGGRRGGLWIVDTANIVFPGKPLRIVVDGTVTTRQDRLVLDGTARWSALGWPLDGTGRFRSSGRLRAVGHADDYEVAVDARLFDAGMRIGELALTSRGDRDRLRLRAAASVLGGSATGQGTVDLRPGLRWQLAVEGDRLNVGSVMADSAEWSSALSLRARTAGRMTDAELAGSLEIDEVAGEIHRLPVLASAFGRFSRDEFVLDSATADVLGGLLLASGRVAWTPEPRGQFAWEALSVNPAPLMPDSAEWLGEVTARGTATGRRMPWGPEGRFQIDTLSGLLRGQHVVAVAELAVDSTGYYLPDLRLDWGSLRLRASGELTEELRGLVEIDAPDLALVLPGGGGSVDLDARLWGTRTAPAVLASVAASDVFYQDFRLGGLDGQVELDLAPGGRFDALLEATDLASGIRSAARVDVSLAGTRDTHALSAAAQSSDRRLVLAAEGGLIGDRWEGELWRLDLRDSSLGTWGLDESVRLALSRDRVTSANPLCLLSEQTRACASGTWERGGGWQAHSTLDRFPIGRLSDRLPDGWRLSGTLDAALDLQVAADSTLAGSALVTMEPGEITYRTRSGVQTLRYDRTTFDLRAGDQGVRAHLGAAFRAADVPDSLFGRVSADVVLPSYRRFGTSLEEQPVTGRLEAHVADLSVLETLSRYLVATSGQLDLNANVDGTVARPSMHGTMQLRDGRADVPALGLELRGAEITATGQEGEGISVVGELASGSGQLRVRGHTSATPLTDSVVVFYLTGERLQVANTPEIRLWLSPDLEVRMTGSRVDLTGQVEVPRAVIELQEIPTLAVPVSPDVVLVGDTTLAARPAIALRSRVRVVLGDSVSFQGFGLSGRLGGALLAMDEPGQPTLGTGQLEVDSGRYRAYGQDLGIETGRLIFAGGPVDNPGLDVRAVRRAQDGTVAGLTARGTLKAPEITVFSDPPMLQSDALAYLLFGRPLNSVSSSEGNAVAGAARSLGLRGGDFLARRIARSLGLDEARIEGGSSWEEASLIAGKYLSSRLYVSYTQGLFEPVTLFQVRYVLSSKWTLQAETGDRTSTDLYYRIERGR